MDDINDVEDEDIKQLMEDNDIDEEVAEKALELINEGLDEEDAIMVAEDM
ncbi:MAG: hypothetical protein WCO06_05135 [Candidatus Roizmanbacteria bacterium]